jgi:hypothetical protein
MSIKIIRNKENTRYGILEIEDPTQETDEGEL